MINGIPVPGQRVTVGSTVVPPNKQINQSINQLT